VASVGQVEQLTLARSAHRHVGRDGLATPCLGAALEDCECRQPRRLAPLGVELVDARQGRRLGPQITHEPRNGRGVALDLDLDVAGSIPHPARELVPER
jgi:hypothetical protein